jgi:hypothetical protein
MHITKLLTLERAGLDLNEGDAEFQSRQGHQISRRFRRFPQSAQAQEAAPMPKQALRDVDSSTAYQNVAPKRRRTCTEPRDVAQERSSQQPNSYRRHTETART